MDAASSGGLFDVGVLPTQSQNLPGARGNVLRSLFPAGDGGSSDESVGMGAGSDLPSDVSNPFVEHGLGSAKGMSELEQVSWAIGLAHPFECDWQALDDDSVVALKYEVETDLVVIDEFRSGVMAYWLSVAGQLAMEQVVWASSGANRTSSKATVQICCPRASLSDVWEPERCARVGRVAGTSPRDRESTRLNSSH